MDKDVRKLAKKLQEISKLEGLRTWTFCRWPRSHGSARWKLRTRLRWAWLWPAFATSCEAGVRHKSPRSAWTENVPQPMQSVQIVPFGGQRNCTERGHHVLSVGTALHGSESRTK